MKNENEKKQVDWAKVVEVIISILTLGLSHLRKHQSNDGNEHAS